MESAKKYIQGQIRTLSRRDTIISNETMKTTLIFSLLIFLLALTLGFANFHTPPALARQDALPVLQQTTATPIAQGISEIGSTSGILFMGVVIVLIVTLPLLFRKRGK